MHIYGKDKDYYDCVLAYGQDPLISWVRKFEVVDNNTFKYPVGYFSNSYVEVGELLQCTTLVISTVATNFRYLKTGYIFFCGKTYPFIRLESYCNDDGKTFYTIDQLVSQLNKILGVKGCIKYLNQNSRGLLSKSRTVKGKITKFLEQELSCEALHVGTKIPVYINYAGNTYIGGCLKDFQFAKVFDPYTCLQEIEMYISGVLGGRSPAMVETSDIIRLESHGFDKVTSFRKAKEK